MAIHGKINGGCSKRSGCIELGHAQWRSGSEAQNIPRGLHVLHLTGVLFFFFLIKGSYIQQHEWRTRVCIVSP